MHLKAHNLTHIAVILGFTACSSYTTMHEDNWISWIIQQNWHSQENYTTHLYGSHTYVAILCMIYNTYLPMCVACSVLSYVCTYIDTHTHIHTYTLGGSVIKQWVFLEQNQMHATYIQSNTYYVRHYYANYLSVPTMYNTCIKIMYIAQITLTIYYVLKFKLC